MLSTGNLILGLQILVILAFICLALEFRRKELAYTVSIPEEQEAERQEPALEAEETSKQPVIRNISLWTTGTDPIFERDYLVSKGLELEAKGADILEAQVQQTQFAEPADVKIELEGGRLVIAPLLFQKGDRLTLRLHLSAPAPAFILSGSLKKVSTVREVRSSPAQLQLMERFTRYVKAASVVGTLLVVACFLKANLFAVPLPGPLEVYLYVALAYLLSVILAFLLRRRLESSSSFAYPLAPTQIADQEV